MALDKIFSAALPFVGGVASSLMGNSANLRNAREQRAHDLRMWQMQADYNKPVNQVARLREAGINPALSIGNVETGTMSNSAGGQTAPTADFSPIAQGLRDSVDLYQQRRMQDAEIRVREENAAQLSIRNRYENQRMILELDKLLADTKLSSGQREYYEQERERLKAENFWIDKRNSSEIARNEAQAFQAQESARYQRVMRSYQEMVNNFTPQQQAAILKNLSAEYKNIMAQAAAHGSVAALNQVEKALKDLEIPYKDKLAKSIADKAFEETRMVMDNREINWLKTAWEMNGKVGQYFPAPAAQFESSEGYRSVQREHKFKK